MRYTDCNIRMLTHRFMVSEFTFKCCQSQLCNGKSFMDKLKDFFRGWKTRGEEGKTKTQFLRSDCYMSHLIATQCYKVNNKVLINCLILTAGFLKCFSVGLLDLFLEALLRSDAAVNKATMKHFNVWNDVRARQRRKAEALPVHSRWFGFTSCLPAFIHSKNTPKLCPVQSRGDVRTVNTAF